MSTTDAPHAPAQRSPNGNPMGFGRMLRKEDARFLRGKGNYVDDVNLPGMLHGAVLRSPLAHGRIVSIEEQQVAGLTLEMFVISFEKDKMTLRVPTARAAEIGMRSLASPDLVDKAMETLKGKARVKRAMWSRRAQEYEQKINSGDLLSIAEVVRDLHRSDDQREQSYSERQLYEAALDRLTREVAAVSGIDAGGAQKKVEAVLTARAA